MMKLQKLALVALALVVLALSAVAQTPARLLTRNTDVQDVLGATADATARVYFFVAVENELVSLSASVEAGNGVGLLLTDASGGTLAQAVPSQSGETTLRDVTIPATANYYVTVFPMAGEAAYTLTLTSASSALVTPAPQFGTQPTPQGTTATATDGVKSFVAQAPILLANGIEVRLEWTAAVDLNLEVRDPVGNTLYFDQRTTNNGGSFGFDANGFCQIISPNPVETATWTPGFLPVGNYEILVFYRQACQTPEAVPFNIIVTVNGTTLPTVQATLNPPLPNSQSVYLSSFRVNTDGSATVAQGGVYPDSAINQIVAPLSQWASLAAPISTGATVRGAIVEDQYFLSYKFSAQENDIINVALNAQTGNLDPLLQIADSNGNLIAVNDDAVGTRNSRIENLRLAQAGEYYLLATRYGKEFGGTEGEFELTLLGGVATVPAEVQALNLAPADIQVVLTWATSADLQLLVRDPFGESVFDDSPNVLSGGALLLAGNVNCTPARTVVPASYVAWGSGLLRPGNYEIEVWYQNDCNDTRPAQFTLTVLVRGQVVTVERQTPQRNQRYVLSFTINPDNTVIPRLGGYAANDAQALDVANRTPSPIALNQPVLGTITNDNVFDVYSFQGTAGQRVTISMAATSPTLDTKLILFAPSGVQVAENDDAGAASITGRRSDALINGYTLTESGEYKIVATRYATLFGGTIGGYSLTVQGN
jgi:uncharacterized protein YfaP (DUF2135 family)